MANEVLKRFKSKITGELYTPANPYATEGPDASEERKAELVKKGFLAAEESTEESKVKSKDNDGESKPVHVGGGMYELPDGTRVKGKEEAFAAMKE